MFPRVSRQAGGDSRIGCRCAGGRGGARWQFASAANRDAFVKSPDGYAPQYGGYCAYAVSKGYTASADPMVWRIVSDRLYVNYSKSVQGLWDQDIPGNITKANRNWPAVLTK